MSAATARGDRLAFSRFLSDDITSIDSAGKLRNKTTAVEEMPPGNSQVSAEIVHYGDGAVVAIGYGLAGESPARILQAWSRKEDQWQMVAFQGLRAVGNVRQRLSVRRRYRPVPARNTTVLRYSALYGVTEFAFEDPDGYVITFAERM